MTRINDEWMRLEQTQVRSADDMERSIVIVVRLEFLKRPNGATAGTLCYQVYQV